MKIQLYILSGLLFLAACSQNEKQAKELLEKAQAFYETAEYASAKQMLDSLKIGYPKEVPVLREGLFLMRQIEISEQERNLIYSDSMLTLRQREAEALKKNFLFEKDEEYEEIGKYIVKQQKLENNLQRSYIRSGVNELGEMYIASVYYGKPVKHTKLKVTAPNGDYTETMNIPADGSANYSFSDGGVTSEIVTYQNGKDNGVILFICDNYDKKLTAEYIGERTFSMPVRDVDKKALVEIRNLSVILLDIQLLKKEIEKSKSRIEYLKDKTTKSNPPLQ